MTLATRSFLLIGALILLSLAAATAIFGFAERQPRAHQTAQMVASVVNLSRAAILAADEELRPALLAEMAASEGLRVYPAERGDRLVPLPPGRGDLGLVTAEVRRRLGQETRFAHGRNDVEAFWVSFFVGDDEFWVMLPAERLEREGALQWVAGGILVLGLALLGAWGIARQVGKPLRALAAAAGEIGSGRKPAPAPESGPDEVAAVARAFNRMGADLAAIERERGLVLAGISHDLRTPLARLRLAAEMTGGSDPGLVEGMARDIEAIDAVLRQFLDYMRSDEGEPLQAGADLAAIARAAIARAAGADTAVQAKLAEIPPLALRPVAAERMVANLIENALRHGGPPVEVETGIEGGSAVLRVLDRGPGVPAGEQERIKQPFVRLDAARTTPGTGLGLAIVERTARAHGGRFDLLARPGGGTEARVTLPLPTP